MWYKIVFNNLRDFLLPTMLRKSFIKILVGVVFNEIEENTYKPWLNHRADRQYRLNVNGQVCYLQAHLRRNYNKGISVVDGNNKSRIYIYTPEEQKTTYISSTSPLIVYSNTDYGDTGVDFIIKVPPEEKRIEQIEADVRYYKQDVKRFK